MVPQKKLRTALASIPNSVDAVAVYRVNFLPTSDYYQFDNNAKFYEKIHYHNVIPKLSETFDYASGKPEGEPKVIIRSQNNIIIAQGNHGIYKNNDNNSKKLKSLDSRLVNILLYEYHLRSVEQTHKKLFNGMKVNMRAQELGVIPEGFGTHWNAYKEYVNKYGDKAAEVKFSERIHSKEGLIDNPIVFF